MTDPHLDKLEYCIKNALKNGADAADALLFESTDETARQRTGKLETIERSESKGIGLRVFVGRNGNLKPAMISSSDLEKKSLDQMVERVIAMANSSPEDPYIGLAPEELFAKNINHNLDLYDKYTPSSNELQKIASEAEESALSEKGITNSDGAEASYGKTNSAIMTSEGFFQANKSSSFGVSVSVIAGEKMDMQTDYEYSFARHFEDLKNPTKIGKKAAERTLKKMNPIRQKTGRFPVVMEQRVARSLIGSFASAINGSSISKGTSFLIDRMNEQIFNKNINIYDDPLIKRGIGSSWFDGEGIETQKNTIVESGTLKSWVLDIRSANKLGLKSTANASRGLSSPPHPSTHNFYLENGTISHDELLSDIKEGFYVTDAFGMGINLITGDYSQGASGFWIKNGKITHAVNEMTIAGNLLDMFKNLTAANDLAMEFSTNSPTLLVEGMTIAGE